MARTGLTGNLGVDSSIKVIDDNVNNPAISVNYSVSQTYTFGTSAGQANVISSEEFSISASATQTLVLDDSSLTDMFGNIADFSNIKGIRIQHTTGSASTGITIGGTFTVAFTAGTDQLAISLAAGGFFAFSDNQVSLAIGAGQTITITADSGNTATVTVDLLGT